MPVPSSIAQLSQTPGSNSPAGSESPALLDDYQRAAFAFIAQLRDGVVSAAPVDLASAATTDIGAQNSPFIRITGTTTITSFGTNYVGPKFIVFGGALTLTHNATSLILPGGANITTAAGDGALVIPNASSPNGWRVLIYQRASGQSVVAAIDYLNTTRIDVASASTVNLTSSAPDTRNVNITGTTTITGFTVSPGQLYFVRFNAALTLTNNSAIITQRGTNIITAAGDTCIIRATAANTVEVLSYCGPASTTQRGEVRLATSAEALVRGNTSPALTPSTLRDALAAQNDAPIFAIRAWGVANGTSGSNPPVAGGNVTSIRRDGVGDYTITFTTAMPSAAYAVSFTVSNSASASTMANLEVNTAPTTTGFRARFVNGGGTAVDPSYFTFIVVC